MAHKSKDGRSQLGSVLFVGLILGAGYIFISSDDPGETFSDIGATVKEFVTTGVGGK